MMVGGSQAQTSGLVPVNAIMVVWGPDGHYQELVPMRNVLECEIAAIERQASDRRLVEAFCRPAEPDEQKKYKLREIALIIRMTPSSTPIRVLMPTAETCRRAIAQAMAELNLHDPAHVYCHIPPTTTIMRNNRENQGDYLPDGFQWRRR